MTSKTITIAADSVCDLPADIRQALNIKTIPTYVNIGDESLPDDGVALDRSDFYQRLPSLASQPTTSAPSPGDAESFFQDILNSGADHILSIHVPKNLSGVYNTMRLGAEAVAPNQITLVDSLQLSIGIGMQVWIAAELAQETDDIDTILQAIERVRQHTELYAIIDTMEYLKRSGRVTSLMANIGSLLKIKPILRVRDGDIQPYARVRTWSRAESKLRELVHVQAPLDRLAIMHIDNQHGAQAFLDSIQDIAPEKTIIVEVTPTLGTHIGPGAIGVTTLSTHWRQ